MMNDLVYANAINQDNRSYIQYYLSLLRTRHILIFTFYKTNDYNSKIIKIYIFFFTFAITYAVKTMFYSDSTMSKIYEDQGNYDFTYQLPKTCYTLIISSILKAPLNLLGLYEKNILVIKYNKNKLKSEMFKLNLKILFFFIIIYIYLILIWIYLGCSCAVYKKTQVHLLMDVLQSFGLSFLVPIFLCLIPGMFIILALKDKKHKRIILYKFSKLLQMIC